MNDQDFLAAFEAAAIPAERWKHRDHVRVAFLYLRDLRFDAALDRLRIGIRALNVANGGENTATTGYHETVTIAWARLVSSAIALSGAMDFQSYAQRNPHLLSPTLLREHYSKERMLSPEARASFVEPDLAPLPDGT